MTVQLFNSIALLKIIFNNEKKRELIKELPTVDLDYTILLLYIKYKPRMTTTHICFRLFRVCLIIIDFIMQLQYSVGYIFFDELPSSAKINLLVQLHF